MRGRSQQMKQLYPNNKNIGIEQFKFTKGKRALIIAHRAMATDLLNHFRMLNRVFVEQKWKMLFIAFFFKNTTKGRKPEIFVKKLSGGGYTRIQFKFIRYR